MGRLGKNARVSMLVGEVNDLIKDWHNDNDNAKERIERINADEFWQPVRQMQKMNEKRKNR